MFSLLWISCDGRTKTRAGCWRDHDEEHEDSGSRFSLTHCYCDKIMIVSCWDSRYQKTLRKKLDFVTTFISSQHREKKRSSLNVEMSL